MHELPIMKSILDIVLKHAERHQVQKIHAIHLEVGLMSDLEEEWMQRYFDYLSEGTIASHAKLKIEWFPIVFMCQDCNQSFEIEKKNLREAACPNCGRDKLDLVSGREYRIKDMEAQ